jgi:hypothetical protein
VSVRKQILATVVVVVGGSLAFLPSCDSQHEGERCDILAANNGSDDCQAPLVCTPADQLRWPVTTDGGMPQTPQTPICCPPVGMPATTEVCKSMGSSFGSDAAIPMTEGGPEASSESGSEASSDAPVDSPADVASDAPADAVGQ